MTAAKTHVPSDRQVHEPALRSKYHAAPSWLLITKSQFEGKHSDSSGKGAIGRPPEHPICDKCSRRHPAGRPCGSYGHKKQYGIPVYVMGPMTGHPNMNREAFERARREIEANPKVRAIIPFDLYEPGPQAAKCPALTWCEAMLVCLPAVAKAKYAYALAGWQGSRGAQREWEVALKRDIPIIYEQKGDVLWN